MEHAIPTEVLKHAREVAGVKQSALAKIIDTNPSVISRLEKAGEADASLAARYLKALGTPLADAIREFYERKWEKTAPPSFLHPNREELWSVETALQALDEFEHGPKNAPILRGAIDLLREDLKTTASFLDRRDHTIAWFGDIGVGKTTALAHATSMLVTDSKGQTRPVFPVGSGRTTVCDTVIKVAPAFGVAVDPLSEDEIRNMTRDLVLGLLPGPGGVSAEINRVIRNMSGFKVVRVQLDDDFVTKDPIADLLAEGLDVEQVVDQLVSRMNLSTRTETQLLLPEEAGDGLEWLARTITKINNGLHERFSAPRRITVLLPARALEEGGYLLSIVDTKGIETITQRPDLRAHMDDPRTLVVICTKFADAPGLTAQQILKENEEAGSDAVARNRLCLLVLPRGNEALDVMDQGEPPSTHAEGYAIRRDEIRQALSSAALPVVPILFFDAHRDASAGVWSSLRKQVDVMRQVHVERLTRTIQGVHHLIGNVDVFMSKAARGKIEKDIDRLVERIKILPPVRRPAHLNLIHQFDLGHQSSIAASIVRRGDWANFPILHILGTGVRNDANLRSTELFTRISHALDDLCDQHLDVADAVESLQALRDRISEWRQEFLAAALSIGRAAFKTTLEAETDLWTVSAKRYGGGAGYKKDLADEWRKFFETSKADPARESVNLRLQRAWEQTVVEPLTQATRATP